MKTIVLIALFLSCCLAQVCYLNTVQCADVGASCSNGCTGCYTTLQSCLALATNATEACDCGSEYVDCLAAAKDGTCDSTSAHVQCILADPTCACGTPYSGPTTTTSCDNTAYCNAGTCTAHKAVGAACNESMECGDTTGSLYTNSYDCVNKKCQMVASAQPGDSCKANTDCEFFASASLGCVSGICASQAVGKACVNVTDTPVCGPGLWCDASSNTCKKAIAMGAACDNSVEDNNCGANGVCSSTSVCIKIYSKSKGQACKINNECGEGLYCSEKNKTCMPTLASNISCTNATTCSAINADYLGCTCNEMGQFHCQAPTGPDAQCKTLLGGFADCIVSNACSLDSYDATGCIATHCASEFSCYVNCVAGNGGILTNAFGCIANYVDACSTGTTGTTTSMGVREIASAGLVALAVAALL